MLYSFLFILHYCQYIFHITCGHKNYYYISILIFTIKELKITKDSMDTNQQEKFR